MAAHLDLVTACTKAAVQASVARDEAIRSAHRAGHTITAIAAASGLSRARVHQIIRAAD